MGEPKDAIKYDDIVVGGTYILHRCYDIYIDCISPNCKITVTDIDSDGDIFSNDVSYRGKLPSQVKAEDFLGWQIGSKEHAEDGLFVLLEVDE